MAEIILEKKFVPANTKWAGQKCKCGGKIAAKGLCNNCYSKKRNKKKEHPIF